MKKHVLVLSLAAILLSAGCSTYDRTEGLPPLQVTSKPPERLILKTEGSPGQRFSAVLTVDGLRREVSGITPTEFPLECVVLVGEVTRFDGDGSFSFTIELEDGTGRFYTPPVKSLRCFRYHARAISVLARH